MQKHTNRCCTESEHLRNVLFKALSPRFSIQNNISQAPERKMHTKQYLYSATTKILIEYHVAFSYRSQQIYEIIKCYFAVVFAQICLSCVKTRFQTSFIDGFLPLRIKLVMTLKRDLRLFLSSSIVNFAKRLNVNSLL